MGGVSKEELRCEEQRLRENGALFLYMYSNCNMYKLADLMKFSIFSQKICIKLHILFSPLRD